jgi:hypothetical protein
MGSEIVFMNNNFLARCVVACLSLAPWLGGCGIATRMQVADITSKCDFRADPRFSTLVGKVPLSAKERGEPPTASEMLNTSKPTSSERQALLALDQEFQQCRTQFLSVADRTDATVANILRQTYAGLAFMDAKLISGEWSYAYWRQEQYTFSIKSQRIVLDYEEAKRAADAARMQAVAASFQAATAQMAATYQANPLVFTNCNQFGSSVSCVSH